MPSLNPVYTSIGCNRYTSVCDSDENGLVAFGAGRFVALWDATSVSKRGVRATLPGHSQTVSALTFLRPIGRSGGVDTKGKARESTDTTESLLSFVTGDEGGNLKLWSSTSTTESAVGEFICVHPIDSAHKGSVSALALIEIAVDTVLLFTGGSDGVVNIHSISRAPDVKLSVVKAQTIDLKGRLPLNLAVALLPSSHSNLALAIAGTERKLHIWQGALNVGDSSLKLTPFEHRLSLEGHEDWIRAVDFATFRTGQSEEEEVMLASGSQDGYIRLWKFVRQSNPQQTGVVDAKPQVDLDDDMLDEFERRMRGDPTAAGSRQLSTKSHMMVVEEASGSVTYGVSLDALLIGHEGWITDLHWDVTAARSGPPRLLSTSADNSMIIWSSEPATSVWTAQQRFGEIGGRGLGLFGAVWAYDRPNRSLSVVANGWKGGMNRWSTRIGQEDSQDQTGVGGESWTPDIAPTGHSLAVKGCQWDPLGQYLVSVSTDQTTRAHAPWTRKIGAANDTTETWGEISRPQIHGYDMTCVAFVDRFRFASGADEKIVRVFDAPQGFAASLTGLGVVQENLNTDARPVGASVPPLGLSNRALDQMADIPAEPEEKGMNQEMISVSDQLDSLPAEGVLQTSTLWPEIEKLYGHGYEIMTVSACPKSGLVASSCKATSPEHAVVRLHDSRTWKQVGKSLEGHTLTVTRIAFSHDGKFVLTCSRDRTWRVFAGTSEHASFVPVAAEKPHARIIWDCAWGSDDSYFVTASRDKQIKFWAKRSDDGSSWEHVNTIKSDDATTAVAIISRDDNDLLAIGHESGRIDIYEVSAAGASTQKLTQTTPNVSHVEQITQMSWRDRGETLELASCSEDRSLRVFKLQP